MSSHPKVINLTTGCRIKRSQAKGRVENCVSAWVDEGFTIRDLTLAERVTARSVQAKAQEPFSMAELPGVVFKEPASASNSAAIRAALVHQANMLLPKPDKKSRLVEGVA
jgi:hypothetical protein